MTVLPIRTVPDPILRTRAQEVPADADLHRLVEDMFETMDDVGGVGLAAPQVGVGLRVFTFDVEGLRGHVVDPVLEVSGELIPEPGEGCLSVPGLRYHPLRHERATVTGRTVDGEPVSYTGEGLTARCLQHETDHLDGILYIDRLEGEERREARRAVNAPGFSAHTARIQRDRGASVGSIFGRRS